MDSLTLRDHYLGGFCLSSLGAYYNQLQMAVHYNAIENPELQEHCVGWVKHIQEKNETILHRYLMVEFLNKGETPPASEVNPPSKPEEYRDWLKERHQAILDRFDGNELICYLYLYGYCQGDLYTALVVLVSVVDLNTHFSAANPEQVEASVNRIQTILSQWEKLAVSISELDELFNFGSAFYKIQSKLHGPIELFKANPDRLSLVQDELKDALLQLDNMQSNLLQLLPTPISEDQDASPYFQSIAHSADVLENTTEESAEVPAEAGSEEDPTE